MKLRENLISLEIQSVLENPNYNRACEIKFTKFILNIDPLNKKNILLNIYKKALHELEISTGLYDKFFFRNIKNNNEYICTAGSSWIISQKDNIKQSNIYQETQNFITESKKYIKYTLELDEINEEFLRLSNINIDSL